MKIKDFKLLLNSTDEEIKLLVNTGNDVVEIDSFELNFKEGLMIINTKTTFNNKI